MARSPAPLREELLYTFSISFATAMVVAVIGVFMLMPLLVTPGSAALFLGGLIAADLAVLFAFGGYLLRRALVLPVREMLDDVRQMTEGGRHRIRPMPSAEFDAIREGVNALADRLMRDQALLADNVASLEQTNAELVEARTQVIRAARLASVGTLAAGIAHEVGNPLGAILGYADVARDRLVREGGDASLLEAIREEALRIDRIVKGLLSYARPWETDATAVSPPAVLERVRDLLTNQGKLDGIEHVWHVDPDLPTVLTLPSRLEQVLVNLLLNAVDALEGNEAPRIEVTADCKPGRATIMPRRRDDDPRGVDYRHRRRVASGDAGRLDPVFSAREVVVIRIADNGPGIPPDHLEQVFDPFFSTKAPGSGTGLGLAICARLVESMGGAIEASNRAPGGAVFEVQIPAMSAPDGEPGADPRAAARLASGGPS